MPKVPLEEFASDEGPGVKAPDISQRYIRQVATGLVVLLRAENEAIGDVTVVMVGMAEMSSCEWTVEVGDWVEKGEEIGAVSCIPCSFG